MKLSHNGNKILGKAIFKDANGTKAYINGTFETDNVYLLMTPKPTSPYDSLPKTRWTGTLKESVIVGKWQLEGRGERGYAVSGPWTAKKL